MLIARDLFLERLIQSRHTRLIKVVTGIRRCGKSFLLTRLFHKWLLENGVDENHIIEISLEGLENRVFRNPEYTLSYIKGKITDKEMHYIIIDEVQLMEDFVEVLQSLLLVDNYDIYVTGSNSKFLSTDIATEFRGRQMEIHLQPLTFSEFYGAKGGDKMDAWNEYINFGGLPQVVLLDDFTQKKSYLSNLYETVYLSDLLEHNRIRNDEGFRDTVRILASQIGTPNNPGRISKTFMSVEHKNISNKTITDYLRFLKEAFVTYECLRYDVKGRKYIGTETKYFFSDVGLRNSIIDFRQPEETHLMENVIYNELKARGYGVDVGAVEIREFDENGKEVRKKLEVDFVINRGSERYYIQSAWQMPTEEKIYQESRPLKSIPDSFKKIIIEGRSMIPYHDNDGILHLGLYDFLLKPGAINM